MQYFVDAVFLLISACLIRNFSFGFFLYVCSLLVFPLYVRFIWNNFSFAINDLLLVILVVSFLIHKPWVNKENNLLSYKFPKKLAVYMAFTYVSSMLLIVFSSNLVSLDVQFGAFFKTLFKDIICFVCGYYAISSWKPSILKLFWIVIVAIGLYGIFVYFIHFNPYIDSLSKQYIGVNRFEFFLDEARGGLQGRTSGTMDHPLTWGQMWGCILGIYLIFKNSISNKIIHFAIPIVAALNVVMSGSRTALLATVILFFIYLFSQKSKKIIRYVLIGIALFSLLLVVFNDNPFVLGMENYIKSVVFFWDDSYAAQANINGSNANMRSEQLFRSIQIVENNSLCGLGYGAVSYFGAEHFSGMRGFESIVYKKIVEQGFMGLFCFVVSFAYFMHWIVLCEKIKKRRILWLAYFIGYFVSIVFTGIQNTWMVFVLISFFVFIRQEQIIYESK